MAMLTALAPAGSQTSHESMQSKMRINTLRQEILRLEQDRRKAQLSQDAAHQRWLEAQHAQLPQAAASARRDAERERLRIKRDQARIADREREIGRIERQLRKPKDSG